MIEIKDNRELNVEQVIQVYRNLHKGINFSIKDKKSGLVHAIGSKFSISNVTCKVREGGRQKVIREKSKNVHAFLTGEYQGECEYDTSELNELYYNPYTLDSFINKASGEKLDRVNEVYFDNGKAYIINT